MKLKQLASFSIFIVAFLAVYYLFQGPKGQKHDIYQSLSETLQVDPSALKGRYFVLHFWAKWCAPCAEEIPHLIDFAQKVKSELSGMPVLAISLDESLEVSRSILPKQGKELPSNFMLLLDSAQTLAERLGSYQYPETYFYDPSGRVIEKWVGPQKWQAPEVMEYFKKRILTNP